MGLEDRIPSRGQVACPAGIQVPGLPGTQKSLEGPLPRSQARYGIRPPVLYQEKERRKPYPRVATWLRTIGKPLSPGPPVRGTQLCWFLVRVGRCPARCPSSGLSQGFLKAGLRESAVRSLQARFWWNISLLVSGFWIFSQSPRPVVEYSSRSWTSYVGVPFLNPGE